MSPTPLLLLFLLAPVHRAAAQAQTGRCAQDEATCADGSCIGRDRRCDGYEDCPDGSDESSCSSIRCQPNEFKCNNQKCVMKNWRCDGDNDCGDNSDEQDCRSNEPGSQCLATELQCADGRQCVPRTFQCDNRADCQDGSDEVGCAAPTIVEQPPAVQVITLGSVFVIRCRAVGTPTPEISWRRNWDHVPDKCEQVSEDGSGTLRCPDAAEADQGAYSCEAINTQGVVFAIPDTNVVVTNGGLCQPPEFNSAALTNDDCQRCFCFGVSTSCYSSGLFMAEMPPLDPRGVSLVSVTPLLGDYSPVPVQERPFPTAAGVQARIPTIFDGAIFFSLPDSHLGDQLNSYGGYVRFSLSASPPTDTPVLVMQGNGVTITYVTDIEPQGGYYDIQVTEGNFLKATGDASQPDPVASREDIMMVLQDMGLLLISAHPSSEGLASMGDFRMDTASVVDSPRGPASLVESCRCPAGYTGLSCQECAEGYQRAGGAWLGQCVPVPEECPDGQYGDPARGIACRSCPCPGPQYQYSQTCYLDRDDQVTCNCPEGFAGRRCESCAAGYRGNPLQGQACAPGGECDAAGSLEEDPDPRTGQCPCKEFATGRRCDRCKPRAFHLAPANPHGCVPCFCMGVTDQCSSCGWFRNQVSAVFYNDDQGVTVTDRLAEEELADVSVNSENRQLEIYNLGSEPVYWSLPAKFLGDKVTAYGGTLRFTQSHQAGYQQGLSERDADVELMGNDVRLLYKAPGPSSEERLPANQTHSVVVPLLETSWMRHDGGPVDREHLMMALADLDYIVIKTAMTRSADVATLADVSLDVATPRETGQARAFSVEQCSCPVGYKGLSCEDCDVGYTRSLSGLYLRRCEPCECGGRSDECDPETGECLNCRDNTEGAACDQCVAGYSGDPLRGQPCRPDASAQGSCNCDPQGSLSASCDRNLQCPCKENVEGARCDRCRAGSFGLGSDEVSGCSSCFCSGVSDRCSEARLYRTHVPMQVVNRQHGFSVVKSSGEEVAGSDSITSDFSLNMVSYAPAGDSESPLYWSLPDLFTGEQLKSYGGSLQWRQEIAIATTAPASDEDPFNVVLQGGGISLGKIAEPGSTERSVTLSAEAGWVDLESGSAASRATLMSVLSDLDALLILAVPAFSSGDTSLRDVVLDTAIGTDTYQGLANGIEQCRCPVGHTGLSCQDCAAGHYEDSEGTCQRCPCNGNEQACGLGDDGQVVCDCKPNFSGDGCQTEEGAPEEPAVPPRATISPRYLQLNAGDRASFDCSAEGSPQSDLQWSGGRGGVFEPDVNAVGGVLAIASVRKAHEAEYTCTATNAAGTDSVRTIIYVRGEQAPPRRGDQQSQPDTQPEQEDRRREQEERRRQEEERRRQEEERRRQDEERRRAEADRQRQEEQRRRQEQERRRQEEERRRAEAERQPEQPEGQPEQAERQPEPSRRPPPAGGAPARRYSPLQVQPQRHSAFAGDSVELQCLSADSAYGQYEWSRARGQPLSSSASMVDDTLVIGETSAEDRGGYICTAQTADGRRAQASAFVDVQEATLPRLQLYPADRQQVNREGSALFQCRVLSGNPQPEVIWKRADSEDGQLPPTAQSLPGGVLRFIRVRGDETGDYTCEATNRAGQVVKTATLTVVAAPEITLYQPVQYRVREGEDVELQCGASGTPEPIVRWEGPRRPDAISGTGGGGSSSAKILLNSVSVSDGGIYTCRADNEVGRTSSRLRLIVEQVRAGGGRPPVSYPPRQRYTRPEAPEAPETQPEAPDAPETQPEAPEGPGAAAVDHGSGDIAPSQGNIQPTSEEYVVPLNGRAELTCQVVDASAPVSISWVRSDGAMPADHIIRGGTLYLNRVQKDAEGSYTCLGLGGSEVVLFQAVATLRVIEPPQVSLLPQRQVVRPGDQVSIECSASGDPPVRLDWSRLGGQLPSAASAIDGALVFGAIAVSDAGRYVCTAENAAGRAQGYSDVLVNAGPRVAYPSSSAASPPATSHSSSAASPAAASEPSHTASHAAASHSSSAASPAAASEPSHAASHADASESSHAASAAAASEPSHAASAAAASEPSHAASAAAASEPSSAAAAPDHSAPSSAAAAPAPSPVSPAATSPVASPSVAAVQQQVQAYVGSTVTLRCEGSGFDGQLSWVRADRREIDRATTDGDSLTISELEEADSGDYRCYVRNYYGYSEDIVRLTVVPAPVAPERPCAPGELPCASGECMAADAFCDGFPDCSDGSDESQCRSPPPPAADDSTSGVADGSETAAPAADSGAAHWYDRGAELAEEQGAGDDAAAAEEDEAANYDEEEPAPAAEEEEAYDGEDYTVPDAEEETDLTGDLADEYDYADYYADYYKEE